MWFAQPFEAYLGRIAVSDVAAWYERYGDRLFDQNIRMQLGLTKVNNELVDTLVNHPGAFWYYNNGITVLCESAALFSKRRSKPDAVDLTLKGASVVNGAQTVAAIHAAMRIDAAKASQAYVSVKVVTTRNTPPDFGPTVTRATNTQNQVEARDFVALDPVQRDIREDFTLTLNKEYTYKRGELDPDPDAGCSVTNAALALACAHDTPALAVRAKNNRDTLWERGPSGTYDILFHRRTPSACQIWRSFQVLHRVQLALASGQPEREGRASAIASQGDYIIAHLVFRQLAMDRIDSPDYDWDVELGKVPDLAATVLGWLINGVDAEFGPHALLKYTLRSPDNVRTLVRRVSSFMAAGLPVPDLAAEYRPSVPERRIRRQNAIHTLVDAGRIREGTQLVFKTRVTRERIAVTPWLDDDPRRSQATWVNHRSRPLLWAYDGQRYSPTGLVTRIWDLAGWTGQPVAVQGTAQWHVAGEGSLAGIAKAIRDDYESPKDIA
jgi:hypothetical protein